MSALAERLAERTAEKAALATSVAAAKAGPQEIVGLEYDESDLVPFYGRRDRVDAALKERVKQAGLVEGLRLWGHSDSVLDTSAGGDEKPMHCPTPGHADKQQSASVNLVKQVWNCKGCGAGGDIFDLGAHHFGYDPDTYKRDGSFPKLLEQMAADLGYSVVRGSTGTRHLTVAAAAKGSTEVDEADLPALTDDGRYRWDDPGPILDGTHKPPTTGVLFREDGLGLFYPGRVHQMFGDDGIGKTWVGVTVAAETLNAGGTVIHLDYDDTLGSNVERLRLLGVDDEAIRTRYKHKTDPGPLDGEHVAAIIKDIPTDRPCVVLIDVAADALSAHGYDEDKAADFVEWAAQVLRPFANAGACVIFNDHVVKSGDNRGHGRGTGAKRAKVDGVCYEVTAPKPLFPRDDGILALTIHKDRHGRVGKRGQTVVRLLYTVNATGGYDVRVCVPLTQAATASGTNRPKSVSDDMERLSDLIANNAGINRTRLKNLSSIPDRRAAKALDALTGEGWVRTDQKGNGSSIQHYVVIPYGAERDPLSVSFSTTACDQWRDVKGTPPYPSGLDTNTTGA